jgi:hypothetical protein
MMLPGVAIHIRRIEPFIHEKVLKFSLNNTKFHPLSLQRSNERASACQAGSRSRSINKTLESPSEDVELKMRQIFAMVCREV